MLLASGGTAAGAEVVPLLERCLPAISGVAARLWSDNAVTHADVWQELGLSTDPATRGVELAMIRSGSIPGRFTVTKALSA